MFQLSTYKSELQRAGKIPPEVTTNCETQTNQNCKNSHRPLVTLTLSARLWVETENAGSARCEEVRSSISHWCWWGGGGGGWCTNTEVSMHIKTRLTRKKLMISTPFIDNWIVTGSVARLSIIIYLILWIKVTIRLLSSQTHLHGNQYSFQIPQ